MEAADEAVQFEMRFWGVRGSIPCAHSDYLEFGGNTACIEIRTPDNETIVIDAGTGANQLGKQLVGQWGGKPGRVYVLLTHFHWDHIQGIPFFVPLYARDNEVVFCSGFPAEQTREVLVGQMAHPYFPVPFSMLGARRVVRQLTPDPQEVAGVRVRAFPMNHPQGAWGYRFEAADRVVVHACDLEHGHPELDHVLREYAENADVLIFDSQFTPAEYERHKGWGHSTWLEGVRVAKEVGAKRLVLFHHDPNHSDQDLREILEQARAEFPNTDAAREGWLLRV